MKALFQSSTLTFFLFISGTLSSTDTNWHMCLLVQGTKLVLKAKRKERSKSSGRPMEGRLILPSDRRWRRGGKREKVEVAG